MDNLAAFKTLVHQSKKIVGFTGAGISTGSGIADYRSQGGIWDQFKPVYIDEFIRDEKKRALYWQRKMALWKSILAASPGQGHKFFVSLQKATRLSGLITQNIDGLHEKSGLDRKMIVNLHGNTLEIVCLQCGDVGDARPIMANLDPNNPPNCPLCDGLLKPNTISFGQQLIAEDLKKAEILSRSCELFIAMGSTLQVQPAASFPLVAKESGAKLAIITLSETPLDQFADFIFNEKIETFVDRYEKLPLP
ncbi:MAG: hypothetical protein D6B25_09205 [Desulfobulbaceae bacterium]|nr:MAG: hypothetical protein D6B25_09205 [Desulfobulbaceae bacterium]